MLHLPIKQILKCLQALFINDDDAISIAMNTTVTHTLETF